MTLSDFTQWITSTSGAITSAIVMSTTLYGIIHVKIIKPAQKWLAKVNDLCNELKPNGGSSLRDAIDRIELSLERHNLKMLSLQDFQDLCLYECAPDGSCTYASKALCELFGLSHNDMLGNGWLGGIDEKYRIAAFHHWKECVDQKVPYNNSYIVKNRKTGDHINVITMAKPIIDSRNQISSYLGIVQVTKNE